MGREPTWRLVRCDRQEWHHRVGKAMHPTAYVPNDWLVYSLISLSFFVVIQLCNEVERMRMQLSNEIEAHEASQDQLAHDLSSSKESLQQVRAQLQLAEKVRRERTAPLWLSVLYPYHLVSSLALNPHIFLHIFTISLSRIFHTF